MDTVLLSRVALRCSLEPANPASLTLYQDPATPPAAIPAGFGRA